MIRNKSNNKLRWYDDPSIITISIMCLIGFIIVLSQSFAINSTVNGIKMFGNVLNHNISYMIVVVYFISLETKFGKKYFNYTNLLLIILYCIIFITSIFTVFQSLSLTSLLSFVIYGLFVIYLIHTFLRDTNIWKEFKLEASPFNDLSNDWYFNSIILLRGILFVVNLVFITSGDGIILELLDFVYIGLFARYIYLYRRHLIKKNKTDKDGSIDSFKDTLDLVADKVEGVYNEQEMGKKIDNLLDKVSSVFDNIEDKIEETKIGEKLDDVTDKVEDVFEDIGKKTQQFIDENKTLEKIELVQKKIVTAADKIDDKFDKVIDKINDKVNTPLKNEDIGRKVSSKKKRVTKSKTRNSNKKKINKGDK